MMYSKSMKTYLYQENATICVVEMIGEHNLETLNQRVKTYKENIEIPFSYLALQVEDWNRDLSPWTCLNFGEGAQDTYQKLLEEVKKVKADTYILVGYSLAGLFSLWVGYQTCFFDYIVACSPSVWFPEWDTYMKEHTFQAKQVYLSLGTKEHKTKHPYMREVKKRIILVQELLQCPLEMNPGNHFQDVDQRILKGIQSILK